MRTLIVIRLSLFVAMLSLAALWLLRLIDDVSGPLLLLCPLVIFTYRAELRRLR
jgi:hypothetical protein